MCVCVSECVCEYQGMVKWYSIFSSLLCSPLFSSLSSLIYSFIKSLSPLQLPGNKRNLAHPSFTRQTFHSSAFISSVLILTHKKRKREREAVGWVASPPSFIDHSFTHSLYPPAIHLIKPTSITESGLIHAS